jgi:colicin import membrane protein
VATTDEELDQKRQHVQKLRDQVAQEEAKRISREADLVNDIAAAQLDAEATRLEAQLAEAKRQNKVTDVKEGASTVLDAIKADQQQADAQAKAQEAAVVAREKAAEDAAAAAEKQKADEEAAAAKAKADAEAAANEQKEG